MNFAALDCKITKFATSTNLTCIIQECCLYFHYCTNTTAVYFWDVHYTTQKFYNIWTTGMAFKQMVEIGMLFYIDLVHGISIELLAY